MHGGSIETMFLTGILFALLLIVAVYDVYHYIIPNELVILISGVVLAFFGIEILAGTALTSFVPNALSALSAFAFYGGLWKISSGRWIGFGDAKLAIPLAFLAGYPGVFSMIVLSFWVGALVSMTLLGIQYLLKRGQIRLPIFGSLLTMKSEIPFAPFLIAGFILSYFYGVDVLSLIGYVL